MLLTDTQKILTGTAQTLLIKTPDEVSAQVTPGEMGVTVRLEVVTHSGLSSVAAMRLEAHTVPNQTDSTVVALAWVHGRRGDVDGRGSQLDGVIHAEVLQLNQLTFRHDARLTCQVSSCCPRAVCVCVCVQPYEGTAEQHLHPCMVSECLLKWSLMSPLPDRCVFAGSFSVFSEAATHIEHVSVQIRKTKQNMGIFNKS